MIPYKEISKLKGKMVRIRLTTKKGIENNVMVKIVDTRRGFKNDSIRALIGGEMDYYIDTSKIISIKLEKKKLNGFPTIGNDNSIKLNK